MAEIDRTRIKSVYAEIKGYCENLPSVGPNGYQYVVDAQLGNVYNAMIDELNNLTRSDYSRHKLDLEDQLHRRLNVGTVKMKMSAVVSRLETDFGFSQDLKSIQPAILINNQNTNSIDIKINFSIESLINNAATEEEKENLSIIAEEIKKPDADWGRLKTALAWILSYSKELSLKVLPIILDYYLKKGS